MVGGAPMYATKDIVDNAVNSKDHTTLVAAVKAAGLVDTLQGPGPVHRVRADQRRVRRAAGRHGRHAAQAGEQGEADQGADLPRGARQASTPPTLLKQIKAGGGKAELKTVERRHPDREVQAARVDLTDARAAPPR